MWLNNLSIGNGLKPILANISQKKVNLDTLAAFIILTLSFLLSGLALAGKMEVIDSIAAVVNDDVIMQSELDGRIEDVMRNLSIDSSRVPPEDVIRSQVLDRLIEEKLQLD